MSLMQQLTSLAIDRGYASVEEMKQDMNDAAYAHLCAMLTRSVVPQQTNDERVIRVYLKQDPTVEVFVKTTEQRVGAKLAGIRKDIYNQKFPRWAPFKNQPEATSVSNTGWAWEFTNV